MAGRRGVAARQVQKHVQEPMDHMQSDEITRKRPWEKVDADGNKIKRKKVPGAKNIRIRKHVQPRNALSCLNELVPGCQFESIQEGGVGQQFGVSVTVEGATYSGYGPSKQIARQNAAEAALVSFVKPPVPKSGPGEQNENAEDKTPWATLAAFAMYKLFNDWKEGRIGTQGGGGAAQKGANGQSFDLRDYLAMKGQFNQSVGGQAMNGSHQTTNSAIFAHLGSPAAGGVKAPAQANVPGTAKPAKQVADNAASLHPVMVLHQMRPTVIYNTNKTTGDDNTPYFYVTVDIDGQQFTGEGTSVKKAKFNLAKEAIYALFGVESMFELPA